VQSAIMSTSSQNELFVTTTKELEPIRGGAELAIIPYTLPLPIEPMEILVVFNIEVEVLEEPITPKLVLIVLPKIGIGVKVTLINSVTHAFEVFCFGYNTKIYTYYGETISSYDSFDYTY